MDFQALHNIVLVVQRGVSFLGVLIIVTGVVYAIAKYLYSIITGQILTDETRINTIRLDLGRILVLGLEFIIAADLIGTTTTPDYYALGMLAIIVIIRTFLSFSLNRELISLSSKL